jgi:hypothetical protein
MTERELQEAVASDPSLIEEGLQLVGMEKRIEGVRPDLLFRDRHGCPMIVELKRGTASREAVGQLMEYIGLVAPAHPDVRGVLVAAQVPESLRRALEHHGLEWRELKVASTLASAVRTPFDSPVVPAPRVKVSPLGPRTTRSRPRADASGDVLIVAAGEAYGIYHAASVYCCPMTYPAIPSVERLGFYRTGIMRELPVIRGVVDDVDPQDVAPHSQHLSSLGAEVGSVAAALRRWQSVFSDRPDVGRARVAVLSSPDSPETVLLDGVIGTMRGDKGIQSRARFDLEDLRAATSLRELRELRDRRRR